MNIKKYFWSLNPTALREVKHVLRDPRHKKYIERAYVLLSRCDDPKKVFSVIKRQQFIKTWPRLRRYWAKRGQAADFKAWWETIYDQMVKRGDTALKGKPAELFVKVGKRIRDKRLKMRISQADFARRAGMRQPDISAIEAGKKNVTMETLARLCRILKIKNLPFA